MAGSSKPPLNCTPRPRAAGGSEGAARPRTRGTPTRRPTRRGRGEVGPRPRRPLPGTGVRARPRRLSPHAGPCLLLEVDGTLHRAVALQHAHGLHHHDSRGRAPVRCEGHTKSGKHCTRCRRKQTTQHHAAPGNLYMPGRRTPPTLARNQSPPALSARSPRDASGRESRGAGPKGRLRCLVLRAAGSLRPAPLKRPETWNGGKNQSFSSKGCSPWIAVHEIRKMRLAVAVRFPVLLFSRVGFFFMPVTRVQRLDSSSKVMSRWEKLTT
ncbi:uncharacterized protein LOC132490399 [Mesoplodon densirostris]|uniref:uncharacterized protein LOC132490399 n=1 Tax=Mesoplodon densirostris TaxID=48708 RepID=UPI0028DC22D7|nr:uncharacterized protein LOC132490399 [Mesoplodon densirostris]